MGLSFVPVTIAGLAGVHRSDAGVASGPINTSRQIGVAVGLAARSAIAAISTSHYVDAQAGVTASGGVPLDHGFQTTLYVLTGLLLLDALIAITLLKPSPAPGEQAAREESEELAFDEAA